MPDFSIATHCGSALRVRVHAYRRFVGLDISDVGQTNQIRRNIEPDDAIALGEALIEAGREVQQRSRPETICVEVPMGTGAYVRAAALNLGGRVVSES